MGLLSKLGKSALRGGPKPSAERIAELQARGFNTDLPLFRGTGVKTIDEEIARNRALHLTDSPYYASSYADGQDSPFNRHSGVVGAAMSREAHKKLQRKANREFSKTVEEHNKAHDGISDLLVRVRDGQREDWSFAGKPDENWSIELPDAYKDELRRRGLPQSFDELINMNPTAESASRPGSNLTKEDMRAIVEQYKNTIKEMYARRQAETALMEASPEYLKYVATRDAYDAARTKSLQAYNPRLSATPHVAPMYTSVKNPYPMVNEEGILDLHESPDTVRRLMSKGYDSAIWTPEAETRREVFELFGNLANNVHGGEIVVFRPRDHLTGAFADFPPRRGLLGRVK